jgi:hypothetical protein
MKKLRRWVGLDIGNRVIDLNLRPDLISWTLVMPWLGGEIAERNAYSFGSASGNTFGRAKEFRPMIRRHSLSLISPMREDGLTGRQEPWTPNDESLEKFKVLSE